MKNFAIDYAYGFDCVKYTRAKGEEVVAHFDSHRQATEYARENKCIVRYYSIK